MKLTKKQAEQLIANRERKSISPSIPSMVRNTKTRMDNGGNGLAPSEVLEIGLESNPMNAQREHFSLCLVLDALRAAYPDVEIIEEFDTKAKVVIPKWNVEVTITAKTK